MSSHPFVSSAANFVRENVVRPCLPNSVTTALNRNDRVGALFRAWGHVYTNQIPGAYYEFGVYRGDSFRAAFEVEKIFANWLKGQLHSQEPWRRRVSSGYALHRHHFYAFDTFEGMPSNEEGNIVFEPGHFFCSLEEFRRLNQEAGIVEGESIRYFQGTFARLLEDQGRLLKPLQMAGIVNVDCDLCLSTRDALRAVAPKLQQGTALLVDDWNGFAVDRQKGQRRAVAEFLTEHPEFSFEPWFSYELVGQTFLVHRAT